MTVRTVQRLAASGALPVAHKLPGQTGAFLFSPADVDDALRAKHGTTSEGQQP